MKRGYFLVEEEIGKVRINPDTKPAEIFTVKDMDYLEGTIRKRPLDLDLHIAIYILESEGMPMSLLDDVKQWVRENPVVGSKWPALIHVENH